MSNNRILHLVALGLFLTLGFFTKASATSNIPGYQADHYGMATYIVTQIQGRIIAPDTAPLLHFKDGIVYVDQGCHSFRVIQKLGRGVKDIKLEFIQTFVACSPETPQQAQIIKIFRELDVYTPWQKDSFRIFTTSGQTLAAVMK